MLVFLFLTTYQRPKPLFCVRRIADGFTSAKNVDKSGLGHFEEQISQLLRHRERRVVGSRQLTIAPP